MPTFSAIVILEYWFKMNASCSNSFSVFVDDLCDIVFFAIFALQIFATSEKSVVLGDCCNSYDWSFFNTSLSESFVNACAKSNVVKELFGVICLVFRCERIIFFVC